MQLSVESLVSSGRYVGEPVKEAIEWEHDGDIIKNDVFVRRLSYQTAITDLMPTHEGAFGGATLSELRGAFRIAHCIVDDKGEPVFTPAHILGVNEDGSPVYVKDENGDEKQWHGIPDTLGQACLAAIGKVNGLGKRKRPS